MISTLEGLEHGGYVPRGRKAEDGRIDERYNLVELSTSSYPARTRKNIEESDGTVIFSLERRLSGGTKLTLELADKLGKPVLHIYDSRKERRSNPDSLRLEIQALTDFLCSNKIETLNVAGPPSGEKVPLGVEQLTHAWLGINGDGYFDLSLRLDESVMPGGNWCAWPVKALAASQFMPCEVARFAKGL